jgi:hypothetical protein
MNFGLADVLAGFNRRRGLDPFLFDLVQQALFDLLLLTSPVTLCLVLGAQLRPCLGETLLVRAVLVVGAKDAVPPAEGGGVVVGEGHVVEVVVVGAGPEGEDVL